MAKTELSKAEWLSKAEAYCARAEHCAADVRRKLYEWGADPDFSDFIEQTFTFHLSPFTLIVSNPPYICESEKKDMRPNVLNYEPASALFVPDSDPLLFYRRIASLFSSLEGRLGGVCIFFEINESYASELSAMLSGLGYTDIQITKDIYGKDRIIEGRMAQ